MTEREALKLAREALLPHKSTVLRWYTKVDEALDAIDKALAQPKEKEEALLRALEIIAVGDAKSPQAQAVEELIALGYWRDTPEARALAKQEQETVA